MHYNEWKSYPEANTGALTMAGKLKDKLNVAVLVAGPAQDDHGAQLHQAMLIEKGLVDHANVKVIDVTNMPALRLKKTLSVLEGSFQVIITLLSNRISGQDLISKIRQQRPLKNLSSLCRWSIGGIDMWIEATRCSQAIYNALKGMENGNFGHFDFLGPLKSAKRLDIQETPVPTVFP